MELERPRYEYNHHQESNGRVSEHPRHNLGPAPLPPDFTAALGQHEPAMSTSSMPSTSARQTTVTSDDGEQKQQQSTNGSATQDIASKELVTSLVATENSFIETLHSLIRRNFASSSALRSSTSSGAWINNNDNIITDNLRASTSSSTSNSKNCNLSSSSEEDRPFLALLEDLRKACTSIEEDPFTGAEMRQVIASTKDGSSGSALQKIRTRLDYLAPYFPTTSTATVDSTTESSNATAQAAKNLASMIAMLRRLQALYKASPSLASSSSRNIATPLPTPGVEARFSFDFLKSDDAGEEEDAKSASSSIPEASQEVYSALQKQAKALQTASSTLTRQDSQDSTNVVRAVEEAEVDLLWGRMSDLLASTMYSLKMDSQQQQQGSQASDAAAATVGRAAQHDYLFGATPALNNETGTFDNQNALPEYSSLEPPSYDSGDFEDEEKEDFTDAKESLENRRRETTASPRIRTATRGPTYPASDEKMQLDLDRMASAIERLYVTAPQLANQRVDPVQCNIQSRQQVREMQLAKLGTAIERLCKGRMEDQRASLVQQQQDQVNGKTASPRSRSKSKEQSRTKKEDLDKLLDEIDRAAARTLDGQRATMNGRQQDALNAARRTARLAATDLHLDKEEIDFKDYLMESAGKGRLTSQDAAFTLSSVPGSATQSGFASKLALKRRSLAHIFDDASSSPASDNEKRNRMRSNSVGATPAPPMPAVPASYSAETIARPPIKKRFSVSRLLSSGKESAALLAAPGTRRCSKSSPSSSRPSSAYITNMLELTYTIEEMTNLGSMMLQVWESSPQAEAQINPEPLSISLIDSRTVQVNQPEIQSPFEESTRLHLTSEAQASLVGSKPLDLLYKADHYEIKIPTAVSTQFTRNRDDLEMAVPYSAQDFRTHQPASLTCTSCSASLADLSQVTRYNDLPSEHWADLLDAWMCHPDQTLSKDIIDKGNNIWPQANQALISTTGIVLATNNTQGWVVADELEKAKNATNFLGTDLQEGRRLASEVTAELLASSARAFDNFYRRRTDTKVQDQSHSRGRLLQAPFDFFTVDNTDLLYHPQSFIVLVATLTDTSNPLVVCSIQPVHHTDGKWLIAKCRSCRALVGRSSPGPRRDIHDKPAFVRFSKFAIQPASTSLMPVCPLSLHVTATLLETSLARAIHRFVIEDEEEGQNQLVLWVFNPYIRLFSNHPTFESSASINATKILYKAGKLADSDIVRLIGNAEHESLIYPRGVCHQITEMLQASTSIYPRSHQKLGEWDVGWLERDIGRRR
ncbi:hypothetical protein P389DRAFT_193920 [Cystobasidium minutum MCA 4210]|uniref:uncharacterized protein n=1 Tax=Cystobasidium minutum MCA 4210 TaxID=1397322 RepID=UPI0034CEAF32|eukprot:jgi/Rhomi1/193920/gm1.2134_g